MHPTPRETGEPQASLGTWLFGRLVLSSTCYAADAQDPEAELRATLEGYRRAFEEKDLAALAGYYAGFSNEQRAALRRYFENADELRVEFADVRIAIIADRAAISFSRQDRFVDRTSGDRQQVVVRVTKLFARGPSGWQIVPEP